MALLPLLKEGDASLSVSPETCTGKEAVCAHSEMKTAYKPRKLFNQDDTLILDL